MLAADWLPGRAQPTVGSTEALSVAERPDVGGQWRQIQELTPPQRALLLLRVRRKLGVPLLEGGSMGCLVLPPRRPALKLTHRIAGGKV